jgi:hypothetical protein
MLLHTPKFHAITDVQNVRLQLRYTPFPSHKRTCNVMKVASITRINGVTNEVLKCARLAFVNMIFRVPPHMEIE